MSLAQNAFKHRQSRIRCHQTFEIIDHRDYR